MFSFSEGFLRLLSSIFGAALPAEFKPSEVILVWATPDPGEGQICGLLVRQVGMRLRPRRVSGTIYVTHRAAGARSERGWFLKQGMRSRRTAISLGS